MSELNELPEAFDPSARGGTVELAPIPIGWYLAQIIDAKVELARNGNGSYLLGIFEVLDGEYRGRKIYQNVTLQNASEQAVEIGQRLLTDIYTAVGVTGPTKEIQVMLYKPVKIRVGIKRDPNGIYADKNQISSVRPPTYEPKRGPRTPATPTTPPASSQSTPSAASPRGDLPWR
jgi:Protein of unknown function (DUF669)